MSLKARTKGMRPTLSSEEGSATVEFAIALPALIVVLVFSLSLILAAAGRTGLQEYARQAARLASMGMNASEVSAQLGEPPGTLSIGDSGSLVVVTVAKNFQIAGFDIPGTHVKESATAFREDATGQLVSQ